MIHLQENGAGRYIIEGEINRNTLQEDFNQPQRS